MPWIIALYACVISPIGFRIIKFYYDIFFSISQIQDNCLHSVSVPKPGFPASDSPNAVAMHLRSSCLWWRVWGHRLLMHDHITSICG